MPTDAPKAPPLGDQLKRHKTELLAAAAVIIVTVALARKRSQGTGSSILGGATPGYAAMPGTTVATTTGTDAYSGMENQILGLQQGLLGLATAKTAQKTAAPNPAQNVATTPYTQETFHGQGYSVGNFEVGNVQGSTGAIYSTFSSYTSTLQALEAGQTAYYEPALGDFAPISSVGQFKTVEHTGKGAQTTTYAKVA